MSKCLVIQFHLSDVKHRAQQIVCRNYVPVIAKKDDWSKILHSQKRLRVQGKRAIFFRVTYILFSLFQKLSVPFIMYRKILKSHSEKV